jgi:hypothetical protein
MRRSYEERTQFEGSRRSKRSGLYGGFEGYKTATDDDYHGVMTQGLIVFDTSVLLNLYRYNRQARRDLFSVMRISGDRLFLPHQVIVEFWRNRESVLRDPLQGSALAKELSGYQVKSLEAIRNWANRAGFLDARTQEFSSTINAAFEEALHGLAGVVQEEGGGFSGRTNDDPVLAELEKILQGKVGAPLEPAEYEQAVATARHRVEAKIPPGYMDAAKPTEDFAGDYLIWLEVMNEAKIKKRDVLIVTGDAKEDWWRRERGAIRGPRPELVRELKEAAGVKLFMLRPDSLLMHAQRFLEVRVHDESVKDVERVADQIGEGDTAESSVDLLYRSWSEILKTIKGRSKVAWLLLKSATIVEADTGSVTIEFQRKADAQAFVRRRLELVLAETINEFFDSDISVIVMPLP